MQSPYGWFIRGRSMRLNTRLICMCSARKLQAAKARLLEVLALLVNKPWKIESASTAVLFRRIEVDRPTLLYDEIDNVFRGRRKG